MVEEMFKLSRFWRFQASNRDFEASKSKTPCHERHILRPVNTRMAVSTDSELPDDALDTIDADIDDTEIVPIAEILYLRDDGPWYTKSELENTLLVDYNIDISRPTLTERLETLMAKELVEIDEAGDTHIFYYKFDESEWPLPPDTVLESADTELSAKDLLGKTYVLWSISAVLAVLLGGLLIWGGAFQIASATPIPFSNTDLLSVGLLTFVVAYVLIGLSVIIGLLDFTSDFDPPDSLS